MTARKFANYNDLLQLKPNEVGQIVFGQLHVNPRPAFSHASAGSDLLSELKGPFDRGRGGPGGWVILYEPELHLGADILVPDLAGWRRERMPERPTTAYTELAPDWVCEILSPSTAKLDRGDKLRVYAREKVPHVWIVDPHARTLEVLLLDGTTYRIVAVHAEDERVRIAPFDAIELDLAYLWKW